MLEVLEVLLSHHYQLQFFLPCVPCVHLSWLILFTFLQAEVLKLTVPYSVAFPALYV